MKKNPAIATLFILVLLMACSKNGQQNNPKDPPYTTIFLWAGKDSVLSTASLKLNVIGLTLQSDHPEVATAVVNGAHLTVTGKSIGAAVITLQNEQNEVMELKVLSRGMGSLDGGRWIVAPKANAALPEPAADVVAADKNFADSLSKALLYAITDSDRYTTTTLSFDDNNTGFIKIRNGSPRIEGSYAYQPFALTLKYDAREEVYQLEPINYSLIKLNRDLTEEIQKKFPDKGVQKVTTAHYWIWYTLQ